MQVNDGGTATYFVGIGKNTSAAQRERIEKKDSREKGQRKKTAEKKAEKKHQKEKLEEARSEKTEKQMCQIRRIQTAVQ